MSDLTLKMKRVCIGDKVFTATLAETEEEIERGLGGVKSLPVDHGMLFILESEDYHSFWMKDVLIPLDMIFINAELEIVAIHDDVPVRDNGDLETFSGYRVFKYVLEFEAGTAFRHRINVGDKVTF